MLKPYPPAEDYVTVSRFGAIRPKSVTVECREDFVLPFECTRKEEFREHGAQSPYSAVFQTAFKDACQAQLHEDDDLPSLDSVLDHLATQPPIAKEKTSAKSKTKKPPSSTVAVIHTPDPSPCGIFTYSSHFSRLQVEFATGHQHTLERAKFYTKYEQKFLTCPLGVLQRPEIDEKYENERLRQHVQVLIPALYEIVRGTPDKADRASDFFKGDKERRALAQKVGPGAFDAQEYAYIRRLLLAEFMPSITTNRRKSLNGSSQQFPSSSRRGHHHQATATATEGTAAATPISPLEEEGDITKGLSEQRRLLFVTDVLLPETITRLTMMYRGVPYENAHQLIQDCVRDDNKDISWVEDIYSARESFLEGRSFRGTATK
ncbi:hypothetical protein DFQ27_009125 [Actinomortierella ambigua]|uniref:Uncharacterized protein n=1 Tax=Actinomortierella ambigua TaxID=1343610 RepID=A0A9P6TX28_9FUNG|nr:hypothetical protein DFQ27_009125 [Actinomortierella ambigua]